MILRNFNPGNLKQWTKDEKKQFIDLIRDSGQNWRKDKVWDHMKTKTEK